MNYLNAQVDNCEVCYKIICKQCGWEASTEETMKIMQKEMTNCPDCGWKPAN